MTASTYRGWTVSYDPPPIPYRGADWRACSSKHETSIFAASMDAIHEEIDLFLGELDDER